jgi:hypothetical protein
MVIQKPISFDAKLKTQFLTGMAAPWGDIGAVLPGDESGPDFLHLFLSSQEWDAMYGDRRGDLLLGVVTIVACAAIFGSYYVW